MDMPDEKHLHIKYHILRRFMRKNPLAGLNFRNILLLKKGDA